MPLYEYRCQSCGRTREALQKMGDPPLKTCEDCGGELKRLVSAPAVQFKGTGWYVTDYAKKSGEGGRTSGGSDKEKDKGGSDKEKGGSDKEKSGAGDGGAAADSSAKTAPAAEKSSPSEKPAASSSSAPAKDS